MAEAFEAILKRPELKLANEPLYTGRRDESWSTRSSKTYWSCTYNINMFSTLKTRRAIVEQFNSKFNERTARDASVVAVGGHTERSDNTTTQVQVYGIPNGHTARVVSELPRT